MSWGNEPAWRRVLRRRDMRLLLGAGLLSQAGDWLLSTGLAFQVYALTGSTLASATALVASQLPQVLLGSVAGVLVDRWDARRVIVVANLLLSAVLLPLLLVRDGSQIWLVVAVVAASSCATPFAMSAQMVLLPAIAGREDLVTANALNAQVQNVARLVGAALGGVLVTTGGLGWLAVADIATFLLAAALVARIRRRHATPVVVRRRLRRDWVEGIAVVRRSRALVVVLLFFAVSGVGEATMGALFAPFVADVLGGSGSAYGAILGVQAVGGIVGGLLVAAVGHRFRPRDLFGWGAVGFGLLDLALFLYPLVSRELWPAMVLIALVGVPGAALGAGMLTVFQAATPGGARGRVFGALLTVQNLAMLSTAFGAGWAAARIGVVPVISLQGAVHLAIGAVVLLALRRPHDAGPGAAPVTLDTAPTSGMLPSMSLESNVRTRAVSDPVAMRALAHPLRLRLQALVAREGSLTAAEAARQLEISHALASHHLRQLAKYGFIEPAEATDNKQHPWRVTATNVHLERAEPEARASADVLDRHAVETAAGHLDGWQARREQEGPAWAEAAGVQDSILYLTADELREVRAAWAAILEPLAAARPIGHAERRPSDAVPVGLTLVAVPIERTTRGG